MIVCLLIPRFELLVAIEGREELLREAVALAPEPDREQVVGEVSGAAEAFGVHPGMRLSEALARCPDLRLVAADPERAANAWESVLSRLEGIGAAVEWNRPGEAYFEADGLRRLYGGSLEGVLSRMRKSLGEATVREPQGTLGVRRSRLDVRPEATVREPQGTLGVRRSRLDTVPRPARIGVAPSRFCSFAAATRARRGRVAKIVPAGAARAFLAPLPVSLLRTRPDVAVLPGVRSADLPALLERFGVRTLGQLSSLSANALADRFGRLGLQARALALGFDAPLEPRPFRERLVERIELPDAASGLQLERMLVLLIDRLLVRPERSGRALRKLILGARFVEQGTWRREVTLRQATVAHDRLRLVLAPKLAELPAPIEQLSLEVASFGPPIGDQLAFRRPDERERRKRLREALRQARATAGSESLLRVLEVDPGSRIPERRAVLTPFPESGEATVRRSRLDVRPEATVREPQGTLGVRRSRLDK